jgi:hypothetical protein
MTSFTGRLKQILFMLSILIFLEFSYFMHSDSTDDLTDVPHTTQRGSIITASSTLSPPSHIRLLVVSVTGTSKLDVAMRIQDSWQKFLGPNDVVATICDVGCSSSSLKNGRHRNQTVVELDPDLVNSIKRPRQFENTNNPWGYRLSQLKFYFGLVSQMRQFVAEHKKDSNNPIPQWILIKDDDAYAHADRLMQLVEGVDFAKEKVSLAGGWAGRSMEFPYDPDAEVEDEGPPKGCGWASGGAGWLISQAMAIELAINQGDRVFDFIRHKLERSEWAFHYDIWIPVIASWGGGRLYHFHAIDHLWSGQKCFNKDSKTTSLASVHMKDLIADKHGLKGALKHMEHCMQLPFGPEAELLRDRIAETKQKNSSVLFCPPNQ